MFIVWLLLPLLLSAGDPMKHRTWSVGSEQIAGGAEGSQEDIFTWGDRLRLWSGPRFRSRILAEGPFGEGGCTTDLDRDGHPEVVTVKGSGLGQLLWLQPPGWQAELVDDEFEMHDCLEATLFGKRGVLAIQRGIQIRFYQRVAPGRWVSRDIYSIYTPSYQSGLALADVDGDGRTDILCGNYWVQSPVEFEQSWRIFAINTWSEEPKSAMFRILSPQDGSSEIVAQAHVSPARLALFSRPTDPRQQWPVRLLSTELALATCMVWRWWAAK